MKGESVESPRITNDENRVSILRKAFDVYDTDGSGSIDYSEFKTLIQDLGWPAHEEFIDRAVRVLDEDMSGEIEFSEFQKWTEFAYASRILYRQEMYGLGPRCSSTDKVDMQAVIDEAHDGKKTLVIRRTSLRTVLEVSEDGEQENQQSNDGSSGWRDENGNEDEERHGRPEQEEDESFDTECQDVAGNEGVACDGKNIEWSRDVDAPIREMATMVLSRGRRSRRTHTSRSRARSVGTSRSAGEPSEIGDALGARTESKTTVRMRFACGQFEGHQVGESGSESGEENEGTE